TDLGEATAECDLFQCGTAGTKGFAEPFMTAASPGVIATIMLDAFYGSHERYIRARAREMRKEYELIVARGFVLQLDCPDLAMERARFFQDESLDGFLLAVALHMDAINEAIAAIPPDRVRLPLSWGNYDGPHTHDVPVEPLLPIIYRSRGGRVPLPAPQRVWGSAPSGRGRGVTPPRRTRSLRLGRWAPSWRPSAAPAWGNGSLRPLGRCRTAINLLNHSGRCRELRSRT